MTILLLPALVGARALFVALHRDIFRHRPEQMFRRSQAGAVMYGGLLVAIPLSVPLLRILEIDFRRFWDAGAIAMLVGLVVTKIGCARVGCCVGRRLHGYENSRASMRASKWDQAVCVAKLQRFPSRFAEGLLAAVVISLSVRFARGKEAGALFLLAAAGFSAGRWLLEPAREQVDRVHGISVNRAISGCAVLLASILLFLQS